jgi:hypothetical protein
MTIQAARRKQQPRKRTRMVRKQIYIRPQQEERLKQLAEARAVSEAELIREAIEVMLQAAPVEQASKPLPEKEAAWQAILGSIRDLKPDPERTEPYRWNREELYEERMAKLLKNRGEEI